MTPNADDPTMCDEEVGDTLDAVYLTKGGSTSVTIDLDDLVMDPDSSATVSTTITDDDATEADERHFSIGGTDADGVLTGGSITITAADTHPDYDMTADPPQEFDDSSHQITVTVADEVGGSESFTLMVNIRWEANRAPYFDYLVVGKTPPISGAVAEGMGAASLTDSGVFIAATDVDDDDDYSDVLGRVAGGLVRCGRRRGGSLQLLRRDGQPGPRDAGRHTDLRHRPGDGQVRSQRNAAILDHGDRCCRGSRSSGRRS